MRLQTKDLTPLAPPAQPLALTTATPVRILLVEDSPEDAEIVAFNLRRGGFAPELERVDNAAGLAAALAAREWDAVLSDFHLPGFDGLAALAIVRRSEREIPFLLLSGGVDEETVVNALKAGACDFILKDHLGRLAPALARSLLDYRRRREERRAQEDLRRFRAAMDASWDAIYLIDRETLAFLDVNDAACRMTDRTRAELFAIGPAALLGMSREALAREFDAVIAANGAAEPQEILRPTAAEPERWVEVRRRALRLGGRWTIVSVVRDITRRKRQERKLARLARVREVLTAINSAIVRVRDRGELLAEACRIAVEQGGFALAWISKLDAARERLEPLASAGAEASEHVERFAGGAGMAFAERRDVAARAARGGLPAYCNDIAAEPDPGNPLREDAVRRGFRAAIGLPLVVEGAVWGVFALLARERDVFTAGELKLLEQLSGDISFALEHLEKAERLEHLAWHDPLTGLPNRALLEDRLAQATRNARQARGKVALALIRLDQLRTVGESLGRGAAERLLALAAARLRAALFERDTLAALPGGVFAVMLRNAGAAAEVARAVGGKLLASLEAPFALDGQELRVSARAGVALYPDDAAGPAALVGAAEAALRQAAASREHYCFYAPAMNSEVAGRLHLENRLRRAVERREFVLHYQPRVDLRDGRLCGVEALLRWQDPEDGLVPPGRFIPLLEETGLIVPVGAWALEEAAAQFAAWRAAGFAAPRIAVNVSQVQMRRADFLATVEAALARAGGGAEHGLDIEITESLLAEDVAATAAKLAALRALGVGVAVDDFGTGYSSLQYLARLPLSALKVDRAFVANMVEQPRDLAMVSTIISLAHNLELKVVAEGVETAEQAAHLRRLRCDQAQGFLYARPMPAAELDLGSGL